MGRFVTAGFYESKLLMQAQQRRSCVVLLMTDWLGGLPNFLYSPTHG